MSIRTATKGAIVKRAATATPTNVVPGVRNVVPDGGERTLIDATCHDSSGTKEYIMSPLRDTLGVTLTVAWDPADTQHEAMRAAFVANTKEYLTLVYPDAGAAQHALEGYYTDFKVLGMNPTDGVLEAQFVYKAVAAETYTQ